MLPSTLWFQPSNRCHDIEYGDLDQIVNETLPALQRLKEQGIVRHIGITGLPFSIFHYVLDRVPPGEELVWTSAMGLNPERNSAHMM